METENDSKRQFWLRSPDGSKYQSVIPGAIGGHEQLKIYGLLTCWSANKFIARGGYVKHRVFFASKPMAIASGFRPCGHCLRDEYKTWSGGGEPGTEEYPWLIQPKKNKEES